MRYLNGRLRSALFYKLTHFQDEMEEIASPPDINEFVIGEKTPCLSMDISAV